MSELQNLIKIKLESLRIANLSGDAMAFNSIAAEIVMLVELQLRRELHPFNAHLDSKSRQKLKDEYNIEIGKKS